MNLTVEHLVKHFPVRRGVVRAVDDVSFTIPSGTTLGLVGESGSGKSTVGRCLLRLIEPTDGRVIFDDTDVTTLSSRELRAWRTHSQMVFQDPYNSLNPRMRIEALLEEPLLLHHFGDPSTRRTRVLELLELVRLESKHLRRFPHELSGGQLQRVGIARALATDPRFLVLDEPTSSLDLSVRAGTLQLLRRLQDELGLTYLLISHDLTTVGKYCDTVAVLYLGVIVEHGRTSEVFRNPAHPYTQALLSAALPPDPDADVARIVLDGEIPSPMDVPPGCRFQSRCPLVRDDCRHDPPPDVQVAGTQHAACVRIPDRTNHIVNAVAP